MKELSIEQKAQRYDEAFRIAQELYNNSNSSSVGKGYVCTVFPELKESENERIRKALIDYFDDANKSDENPLQSYGIHTDKAIAWLEKQGEHLENYDEAEKEKSDFVGDGFIECHADFLDFKEGNTYWLEYMGDDKYNVRSDNLLGKTYHITPCQLYTVFKKLTWLEKQGESNPYSGVSFKYNGHIFGMCARDGGVEILMDGNLKAFISLDKSFIYPVNPTPLLKTENFYVSKVDGLLHNITDDFEKKELKRIIPVFNIGNTITKKHNSNINDFGSFIITDITGGKYWYNDRIICDISEQDEWEIYEPNKFVETKLFTNRSND